MTKSEKITFPLISIITVVYNSKDSLITTINSIKKQTYTNIQFVVVDGNSDDGTVELLENEKDSIDKFISEPDDGLYYAMNKGCDISTGDFALFMNAGDIFVSDQAIEQFSKMIEFKDALYFGNTIVYFNDIYKTAPIKHHQSVFFPKSYYKRFYYAADKFKITAEGDYITKAVSLLEESHLDVDLIYSKVEGLRVLSYSSLKGMRLMYREITSKERFNKNSSSISFKLKYLSKSLVKYFAFKVGGLSLVTKIVLNSYSDWKPKSS